MEDGDDEAPLAIRIPDECHYFGFSVGFTVITGYLGAGKSTDSNGVLKDMEKEIRDINSLANIIPSVCCEVDSSKILNCRAYDATHIAHIEALMKENEELSSRALHDSGVRTLFICESLQIDLDKEILWDKKYDMDVYRCKGVLHAIGSDMLHILQAVREIYDIVPACSWLKDETKMNKIVFIGHNLNGDIHVETFRACISTTS